jgi:hypothetical protein
MKRPRLHPSPVEARNGVPGLGMPSPYSRQTKG